MHVSLDLDPRRRGAHGRHRSTGDRRARRASARSRRAPTARRARARATAIADRIDARPAPPDPPRRLRGRPRARYDAKARGWRRSSSPRAPCSATARPRRSGASAAATGRARRDHGPARAEAARPARDPPAGLPADEVTTHAASRSPPPPARSSTSPPSSRPTTSNGRRPRRRSAASEAPPPSPTSSRGTRAARGRPAIKRLLERRDIGRNITKHELELRFLAFLDAHRLPRPQVNATVDSTAKEVDCLWPDQRLIAELDGFATHGTRTAFETDRARDRALLVAGHRVVRVTWRQLTEDEQALAGALRSLLDAAPASDH